MQKIIYTALLFVTFQIAKAQTFNPLLAAMLQDTLDTYVSQITNIKGMSASVYIPGQGLWQGTSGVSYAGHPITKDMKFGIASNTKLFVATVMLKLQEDGILSLSDSVHKWLPNYPNVNPKITIRQLLNHTSGVSDPIFLPPWMDTIMAHPTRVFTSNEVLSWLGSAKFAPGTGWYYSNVNYILAGMIAKSATGYPISKLIRDSIFTPLNLDSTFYDIDEAEQSIVSHRWFNGTDYSDTSRVGLNSAGGCAGAIFSTSSEMAQWYHALFSGQVINATSMALLSTFIPTGSAGYDYSLGLDRSTTLGTRYWGHGGSTWGYKSKMIYDTCMGTVVCGLTNSWPSGIDGVTFLLYRVVLNHVPMCAGTITGTATLCQRTNAVVYTVPPITNAISYKWILPPGATGNSTTNTITVDYGASAVSGNIMVSGVNNYGAGGNTSRWITVNPKPLKPVIVQNGNVLSSSAANGNQWYNSGAKLVGETNQTYTVTKTDDYFAITTLLGCNSDTSNILHVVYTGMKENYSITVITLLPNPVSNELVIEKKGNHENVNFEVFNSLGQLVLKSNFIERTIIQTSDLTPGFFLIKFEDGINQEFKKFIKD